MFSSLMEILKRPIYSDKEAAIETGGTPSTTSDRGDVEHDHISYDPFGNYSASGILGETEHKVSMRNQLIRKWRGISQYPEVDEALQEICGEAIVYSELEKVIDLDLSDLEVGDKIKDKIIESFEKILYMLDFNVNGEDLFRQWYVDGSLNFEVVYDNAKIQEGIKKLIHLAPFNLFKYKDATTGQMKWFIAKKPTYNIRDDYNKSEKIFLDEQIASINSGVYGEDKNIPLSHLNKAVKSINQLYLIEDSIVIFRITRSPEKRVFYIDTGNLPKTKAEEYIKNLIAKYRQKKIYNIETGTIENKHKSMSILEDFWLPRTASGKGTQIDTLQGTGGGMQDLSDIDYFVGKVYRALNVPKSRVSGETKVVIGNTLDIERDELKFFKFVLKLRRKFNNLFVDLLKKDLIARKVMTFEDWSLIQEKIKFNYANNNEYAEIKRLQILEMRVATAERVIALEEAGYYSKEYVKRNILAQTDEEIRDIKKQRKKEEKEGGSDKGDKEDGDYGDEGDEKKPKKALVSFV